MTAQTPEQQFSHHVRLVLDNDHGLYDWRCELVREHLARYSPGRTEDGLREARYYLSDALRDWCEELCGLDAVGLTYGDRSGEPLPLSDLARELLGLALAHVDWYAMARDYIAEELEG